MAVSFEKKLDLIRKANATLKKEKITTLLGQASKIDSYSSENQTKIKGNVDSLYNQIAQAYAQKKKAVAQANAPTTKTRKKPKKEDTMMGYASMIMKRDNITWKQALKKSKDHFADLRTKKQDAEKKALEDFEKKVGAVEFEKATRYKIRNGTKGTDIERDKVRPALPSGKRIVRTKGKTTNQYGTYNNKIGKVYYEKRANRMDINQPSKSVYPKLADGGEMKDGKFSYKDYFQAQGGIKFQSEEEAKQFIKSAKPFVRKKLRGGDLVLVNNGKEYFIAEKVMIDDKYAKGGEVDKITPELNQKITKRAEEIYKLDGGKSQSDFDKAMNKAIVEYGFKPSSYHSAMMEIGAEYDDADGYYAKGGKMSGGSPYSRKSISSKSKLIQVDMSRDFNFLDFVKSKQKPLYNLWATKDKEEIKINKKPMTEKEADKMYEDAKKSGQYSSLRIISDKVANDLYAKGGKIGFDALAKKVARSYKGKKVKAKYQNEYGKTYDSKEAMEVGQKVASKVYRRQLARKSKMADGGTIGESYSVQIFANGQVGEYPIFPNAKRKFDDLNDAMKFAKSMVEENYSEIDKIKIFSSDGRLVQEFNNRDSDKNVKEAYLYKQKIPNNYQGKSAEKVWSLLTPYQRSHYLDDHENGQYKELVHSDWNDLNDRVRNGFEMHVQQGQYAKGGDVERKDSFGYTEKDYNKPIGRTYYTLEDFIDDRNASLGIEGDGETKHFFFDDLEEAREQHRQSELRDIVKIEYVTQFDTDKPPFAYETGYINWKGEKVPQVRKGKRVLQYDKWTNTHFAKGGEIAESNRNMALNKAKELCHHVDELHNVLKGKKHIEAWVIAKLERASSDLSDVTHYLDGLSEQKTH